MERIADRYPEQYEKVGVAYDSEGNPHPIYEVKYPTVNYKGRVCALCGIWDEEGEFRKVAGRWYCLRNGCAEEKLHDRKRAHR